LDQQYWLKKKTEMVLGEIDGARTNVVLEQKRCI
jgi:hypothetical protein